MQAGTYVRSRGGRVFGLSSSWINAVLVFILVLICGMFCSVIRDTRLDAYKRASIEVANLSGAVKEDIERNILLYDLSLQGVIDGIANPAFAGMTGEIKQLILFDRATAAPFLGHIMVIDDIGRVIFDSASINPRSANRADRDYFKAQAERSDLGLYVGRPMRSALDGQMVIGISRRINNADGSFGGVVAGTLRLDYLHQLFSRMNLGRTGSMTLLRDDGTIVMREPFDPSVIGRKIKSVELFSRMSLASSGEFTGHSPIDGMERLNSFRKLPNLPLVQIVAQSTADIYADWSHRALTLTVVLVACCGLIAMLTMGLKGELARRIEAEAALQLQVEEDALTKIANRRRFEDVLHGEWQRAIRQATPLSILMIDADQFKSYNDSFGHPAGDLALKALADCLTSWARRPRDLAARHGGEEFAMILPDTDADSAMRIAESLRQTVLDLGLSHPSSKLGQFSISVGVACCVPGHDDHMSDFVAAADAALYASKAQGRNRCTLQRSELLSAAA